MITSAIDKNFPDVPENKETSSSIPETSSSTANNTGMRLLLCPNNLPTDLPNWDKSELYPVIPTIPIAINIRARLN